LDLTRDFRAKNAKNNQATVKYGGFRLDAEEIKGNEKTKYRDSELRSE
jgi:hypothetical protein